MNSNFTMYKLGMIYICIVWHPGGIGSVANDQYFLGLQNRHKYKRENILLKIMLSKTI